MIKNITLIVFSTFCAFACLAQEFRGLDKSPMDRAYLPDDFSHDRKFAPERNLGESPIIKLDYSRPQKKDRKVFGGMVKYNEIWRLGANEATEITVYKDIKLGNKELKKGIYSMFAIPSKDNWTIILNTDIDHWGHYSYKEENDVLRINVPVRERKELVEAFSIQFEDIEEGKAILHMAWDMARVEIPVRY